MADTTPSQAEGEREDDEEQRKHPMTPHTTPSQAEGERDEEENNSAREKPA
ncbi:hypothetical protein [Streptomyces orinoci]|uniref:Uncharacterized protein n=1 Tax=Streptomyces orinoci TaxID=67339 RepID=A0ABV3K5F5_STRON|nr:hypothetical protein [Streptomyces orinoci]